MPWGLWADPSPPAGAGRAGSSSRGKDAVERTSNTPPTAALPPSIPPSSRVDSEPLAHRNATATSEEASNLTEKKSVAWNDSLNATDWAHFKEPRNWVPTLLVTTAALGALQFYRSYVRRIPGTAHIAPGAFRKRSLLGKVTSVGDGDNFHLFHTPGGRLAGWGWLRKVPVDKKEIRGRTIPIRIAGVDAPEGAHFGRPAQPFAAEALEFLRSYIEGRRVRAYIYKRDQYDRVVATVFVRRPLFFLPRRDVGLEMLRRGLATTYEAKSGAEFGGEEVEKQYREAEAEARKKKKGLWAQKASGMRGFFAGMGMAKPIEIETPREYKTRWAEVGKQKGKKK